MDNPLYNSLTEKLIQDGILSLDNEGNEDAENFFAAKSEKDFKEDENIFKKSTEQKPAPGKNKKRLNDYDLDLIENPIDSPKEEKNRSIQAIKRFLNFKQNKLESGSAKPHEVIFARLFPRLYKAKLIKEAMAKFPELNINTKTLLDKTIPYGENETRYEDLVKFLNYANELQTRLKKEI